MSEWRAHDRVLLPGNTEPAEGLPGSPGVHLRQVEWLTPEEQLAGGQGAAGNVSSLDMPHCSEQGDRRDTAPLEKLLLSLLCKVSEWRQPLQAAPQCSLPCQLALAALSRMCEATGTGRPVYLVRRSLTHVEVSPVLGGWRGCLSLSGVPEAQL
ncbi:hypothetical protein P7K49_028536 [Saguinus oedipus]|uniref:Uncharacterized protein n=1 Tax=Saguinus oedipus TaxID=9490 RepID=A0ABQ9U4L3_SAGOE|nr:hypothetical protein P7K49_028536 [Saguinus oedipus]